jgi:hypothetical protein
VADREYIWTDAGKTGAARNGVAERYPADLPMIVTGVRLPSETVQRLDAIAGNDKGGRSGLIRRAIDEFLDRHAGEALA